MEPLWKTERQSRAKEDTAAAKMRVDGGGLGGIMKRIGNEDDIE